MKLVELLAKELSKWPDDAHIAIQDPDYDKTIWFLDEEHDPLEFCVNEWKCESHFMIMISRPSGLASDYKTAIVTRAQWQAERDRQKCGEWKRHRGGKQPVADGVLVEYKLRGGYSAQWESQHLMWPHAQGKSDIMKYRIIEDQKNEMQHMNTPNARTIAVMDATDRGESLIQCKDSADLFEKLGIGAKTDQIDGPILWRDTVNELDAYIEEFTREREALINRLALEGLALLPAMHPVMGVAPFSLPDSEWKIGDLVTSKTDYNKQFTQGKQYKLTRFYEQYGTNRISIESDDKGAGNGWIASNFKFHSRP